MAELTTQMLVESVLGVANSALVVAVVEHRGNAENGAILVRLDYADGSCSLESRIADWDGGYAWVAMTEGRIDSAEATARIARTRSTDPDLWVIAVDATLADNPFRVV